MVDKGPTGKKRSRSRTRRPGSSSSRRRKPEARGASPPDIQPRGSRPVRTSRRSGPLEGPQIQWMNALAVAAMAGSMIFMLQGPLVENASAQVIRVMSGAIIVLALFTFWTTRYARPIKAATVYLVIIACTGLHMKFRVRDYLDTSVDFVIILQGMVYLGYCGLAMISLLRKPFKFKRPVVIAMGILAVLSLVSIINSPASQYSTASTIAMIATMFFAAHYATNVPSTDMAATLALATAPIIVLTFIVFLFPGNRGEHLWVYDAGPNTRLHGVANNPIGLALFSAQLVIGLVAKTFFNDRREPIWIVAACILMPIALTCLWFSGSRGPSVGLAAALVLGTLLALRPLGRATIPVFFALFVLMLPLVYFTVTEAMSNDSLSAIARSGQAEEVATLTGRTMIWQYTLGLIPAHLFLGHGLGSPLQLFADVPPDVSINNIVEAHNILLHAALMIGVPGALVLAWLMLYGTTQAYAKRNAFALMALLFFVVTGISENFAFPNRPAWHTLIFFALLLSVSRQRQGRMPRPTPAVRQAPGPTEQPTATGSTAQTNP